MSSTRQEPSPGSPVPPPPPTQGDLDTEDLLKENDASLLSDIHGRAEKWAGGLTALTGLLSTALFIKGPTGILDVPEPFRVSVALLIVAALILLIIATLYIYSAAYGAPTRLRTLDRQLPGLQLRFILARERAGNRVLRYMQIAVGLTLVGIALLFGATMLTWFAESGSTGGKAGVCIEADGITVKLGELQAVDGRQQLTIVPCPG